MKDYIKITNMSEQFTEWHDEKARPSFDSSTQNLAWEARMWELRFMLAIAQQVSMVAAHLGKITRKAEELNG